MNDDQIETADVARGPSMRTLAGAIGRKFKAGQMCEHCKVAPAVRCTTSEDEVQFFCDSCAVDAEWKRQQARYAAMRAR